MTKKQAFKIVSFIATPLVFLDELARGFARAFRQTRDHVVDTWKA
jgi:hypothetical protein